MYEARRAVLAWQQTVESVWLRQSDVLSSLGDEPDEDPLDTINNGPVSEIIDEINGGPIGEIWDDAGDFLFDRNSNFEGSNLALEREQDVPGRTAIVYEFRGVRVIINPDMPLRSTAYYY